MNSMFYNFFMKICHTIKCKISVLKSLLFESFIYSIGLKLTSVATYLGNGSCVVDFFKSNSAMNSYVYNSVFVKLVIRFFNWIGNILKAIFTAFSNSVIVSSLSSFCSNSLNYSIRHYGVVGGCFVVSALILNLLTANLTAIRMIIYGVVLVVSLIMVCINTSIYNSFINSFVVRKFMMYLEIDGFVDKDIISLNKKSSIVLCVVIGIVSGIFTCFFEPLFVIIGLCGIIGLSAVLYDYRIGVYIGAITFPFLPTMVLVGLIMLSFASMIIKLVCDENLKYVRTALDFPLIIFGIVLCISAITSFAVVNSIMVVMVYLAFMLSYFLLTNTVKTKKQLYALISALLAAAVLVALYGIYQHVFGFPEGATWIDADMFSDIETRVVSTFENPNVLGEYLLLTIPLGMALVWSAPKKYNRVITLFVTAVLALCMIYTYSRGNWLGLMFAVFLFFVFYDRKFIWLGVLLLLFAPLFLPDSILNRFLSIGNTADSSTSYRVYIWLGTFLMIKDYWLCGIGPGPEAFGLIYPRYAYSAIIAPHSHNLYLQIIVEHGILGVISFALIIIVYYKEAISTYIKSYDKNLKAIIIGLVAGMFGFLIQGLFDNVWYNYRIVLMFFMIIGVTSAAVNIAKLGGGDN